MFLPGEGAGFWPLVSMGAILGGTMRSPFTGIVFALELTHDVNMLLPLLVAVVDRARLHRAGAAALDPDREGRRRGYHLSREYAIDPLEILFVREVMRTNVVALPADDADATALRRRSLRRRARSPAAAALSGRRRATAGCSASSRAATSSSSSTSDAATSLRRIAAMRRDRKPVVAYPDEPLRVVVVPDGRDRPDAIPVVERGRNGRLLGMISLDRSADRAHAQPRSGAAPRADPVAAQGIRGVLAAHLAKRPSI